MDNNRITPDKILSVGPNELFGFGSNESGIHGAGAAKFAMTLGAIWGQAYGEQGRTFAIPTKDKTVRKTLPLDQIQKYVSRFLADAAKIPTKRILMTEIGCGLAGLTPLEVAPLFKGAELIMNVCLPASFWKVLGV